MRGRHVAIGVSALALCAWCGWVSGYHRSSGAADVTWLVTVVAVLVFDLSLRHGTTDARGVWHLQPATQPWPRPGHRGRATLRGVELWVGLMVIALGWDILGIDTGPHQYHLTISALAQAYRPLNAAVLLVWVLVGIGYQAARVRAPIDRTHAQDGADTPDVPKHGGAFALATGPLGTHQGAPALLLPQNPAVGVVFWLMVPIAAVLIEVAARHSQGRWATAEEFIRFISSTRLANIGLVAAWLVGGYHLFAR